MELLQREVETKIQSRLDDIRKLCTEATIETVNIGEALEKSRIAVKGRQDESKFLERLVSNENCWKDFYNADQECTFTLQAFKQVAQQNFATEDVQSQFDAKKSRIEKYFTTDEEWQQLDKYKQYKRQIWRLDHPNEPLPFEDPDDIVVENAVTSLECPLTQKRMIRPVKNRACGHSYEEDAIKNEIRRNRGKCNCPMVGCYKQVTIESLEKNIELEVLIQKANTQPQVDATQGKKAITLDEIDDEDDEFLMEIKE